MIEEFSTQASESAREGVQRDGVSVESLHAWNNIRANYTKVALDNLEECIRKEGLQAERHVLIANMNQFIDRTFAIAQPNLRVNGRMFGDTEDSEPEKEEPFDEALDRRIWSLADNRLKWHKEISEKRRTIPQEKEAVWHELIERHHHHQQAEDDLPISTDEEMDQGDSAASFPHIEEAFHKNLALVEEVSQVVASQQERADRYEIASSEVKTLKA